jgi:hypothetical protein
MSVVAEDIREYLAKQPWSPPMSVGNIHGIMQTAVVEIMPSKDGRPDDGFSLHVWEMPQPNATYTVALDPASGREGGDPSAIQVVGAGGHQVAEMLMTCREIIEQTVAAIWLANFYNESSLVIEANGPGTLATHFAIEMKYKNLWHDACVSPGFLTTMRRRDLMISNMRSSLIAGEPSLKSNRLREELYQWWDGGLPNDALTMAVIIARTCHGKVRL